MSWKKSIRRQRVELARALRKPIADLSRQLVPIWGDRHRLESLLTRNFSQIPHCMRLYVLGTDGIQITDNIGYGGSMPGHYHRDRSQRPYMKEVVPAHGFLISDAYMSLSEHRPLLTALQIVRADPVALGFLGIDFDLRDLPATAGLFRQSAEWRQIKGDPAIRRLVFQQSRVESPLDKNMDQVMSILEELLTQNGIFQVQIHFASSQAIIWLTLDPYRYRLLDIDALTDPDICLAYPHESYPSLAQVQPDQIARILDTFKALRTTDNTFYLRQASINIFSGMISVTFSCDGTHYMRYDEFLEKSIAFWFGNAQAAAPRRKTSNCHTGQYD
ncbi:MAG: PDC sensor domain-containing protein [Thiohalophilus sp.]